MSRFDELLDDVSGQINIAYQAGGEEAMAGGLDNTEERIREARLMKMRVKMEIIGLIGRFIGEIFNEGEG